MARRCSQLYVSLDMAYCCSLQVSLAIVCRHGQLCAAQVQLVLGDALSPTRCTLLPD